MNDKSREAVDALATRLLAARAEFDSRLHEEGKRFPNKELDSLWERLIEYCNGMKGLDWIHGDVAREFSSFREYLDLEEFGTPGEALAMADRMECMLFADYDPYLSVGEAVGLDDIEWEGDDEFGVFEGVCAACDGLGRLDDLGLCEDCSGKMERDLLRQRDWVYSATAYGMSDEQRETVRRQVVKQFGEKLELLAVPKDQESHGKRRKRRKPRSRGGGL